MRLQHLIYILFALLLVSCAIPDDIPYPTVESEIMAFEVEGQCDATGNGFAAATIDKAARKVYLYVNDQVDLSNLHVTKVETSNDAHVIVGDTIRFASDTYPTQGVSVAKYKNGFYLNCNEPQTFILRTYQDYEWTVSVTQVITREVEVEGQVGNAVIDPSTRIVIIYVNESQNLAAIKVKKFSLGGVHGSVQPDPTQEAATDFTAERRFYVRTGWSELVYPWLVYVYTTAAAVEPSAEASTTVKGATLISGNRPNGVTPVVEYKAEGEAVWTQATDLRFPTSTTYEAELTGLKSDVKYLYHVTFNGTATTDKEFYFIGEQLENSSLDEWHIKGEGLRALYCPWAEGAEAYWDTGNHGATTVGASNSTFVDEDGRRYANLQSRYIVIKFAAGNIFTGQYIETDGSNGVLSFGRPFTSRPSQFQFDFQYKSSIITRNGGEWKEQWGQYIDRAVYEGLKGKPDSCNIYIALGDWTPETYKNVTCPYLIRTRPSALHLMDLKDSHLIGFAYMTCGEDVSTWTTKTLDIAYRNDRTPTTVIVVASSSKYGDYFTGGEESLLKVDNFKLKY